MLNPEDNEGKQKVADKKIKPLREKEMHMTIVIIMMSTVWIQMVK